MKGNHIDFLGIGAQKAGTSWLYQNLSKLSEFELPPVKELHYFDRNNSYPSPDVLRETYVFKRILNPKFNYNALKTISKAKNSDDFKFYINWFFSNYSDEWYVSLFDNLKGYKGEITPSYSILNESDIKRIYKLMPDARIIFMVRNPIDRAWSHYRHNMKNKKEFNFEEIDHDTIINFIESEDQLLRSDYIRTINNYTKFFSKEQILICFYDAIIQAPEPLLSNILNHICGTNTISTSHLKLSKVVNKSPSISFPMEVKTYLKDKYYDQIKELSDIYGGYFSKWLVDLYGVNKKISQNELAPTVKVSERKSSQA